MRRRRGAKLARRTQRRRFERRRQGNRRQGYREDVAGNMVVCTSRHQAGQRLYRGRNGRLGRCHDAAIQVGDGIYLRRHQARRVHLRIQRRQDILGRAVEAHARRNIRIRSCDAPYHAPFSATKFNLGTMSGHAYINGTALDLVFPCEKLLTMLTKLGSQISSLNGITGLLKNYDNMMIGFEFTK